MSTDDANHFHGRELDFETQMSPAEAAMWRVGSDPWLDPSGTLVAPLDRPADMDHIRAKLKSGVAAIPRLAERVVEGSHPLETPHWELDPDFDITNHLDEVEVDAPGNHRALLDLATELHCTPYDPDRPPWLIHSVRGLADGKGALIARLHHSVADGIGALRLSEMYLDVERNSEPPPDVDIASILAGRSADTAPQSAPSIADLARSVVTTPISAARSMAGEAALIGADPARLKDAAEAVVEGVRSTLSPLVGDSETGSPLWAERSGQRHLVTARMPLDAAKRRARAWGGTINDLYVTALAETASLLHIEAGIEPPAIPMSFVRSTRSGTGAGGNAFTPTPVTAPGGHLTSEERFKQLSAAMAPDESSGSGISLDTVGAIVAFLPASATSRLGRRMGRQIDIVTSNLRGAPIPIYVGRALVEATYPIGPVAGAACNATVMSYDGSLDMGVMIDPAAISDPEGFARLLQATLDRFAASD